VSQAYKAFYRVWWLSVPPTIAGIILLLLLHVRWVLDGGLRHWSANAFLPWLALGIGLTLWLLVPAVLYMATANPDDSRAQRLAAAWQRFTEELSDWIALPLAVLNGVARWGALAAMAALAVWFFVVGDDSRLDFGWVIPVGIRFGFFLLLYLNIMIIASVVAGLWTLLRREEASSSVLVSTSQHFPGNKA
jgi:hypothetical protein